MTTVSIPGLITAIEYDSAGLVDFDIVSLSDGTNGVDLPTTVSPSGKPVTVVLATNTQSSGFTPSGFAMSSSFNIGDVVEIYLVSAPHGGGLNVFDENGNTITADNANPGDGFSCRKLTTGAGRTWGKVGS